MKAAAYEFERLEIEHPPGYVFQSVVDRRLTTVYHSHDFYELIWQRRGWSVQIVDGGEVTLREGEALFLRPGEAHRFVDQTEEISVISLSVSREELEGMAGAFSPSLSSHIARASGLVRLMTEPTLAEVDGKTEFDCKYLLSFFLRSYAAATRFSEEGAPLPPRLASLTAAMREMGNLREGVSAALRHTHYSQCHLARLIRAQYGVGLKEWINELRLQAAYRELILSDVGIAALSDSVGFASTAHFCRIFKRRFGMSPAALRRKGSLHTV